jgi:hypothetical protein
MQMSEGRFKVGQLVFHHLKYDGEVTFSRERIEKVDDRGVHIADGHIFDGATGRQMESVGWGYVSWIQEWVDHNAKPDVKEKAATQEERTRPKRLDIAGLMKASLRPSDLELKDKEIRKVKREARAARKEAADLREQMDFLAKIGQPVIEEIPYIGEVGTKKSTPATALLIASDWHVEEVVDPKAVNHFNKYNPEIAKERSRRFFEIGHRLTEVIARDLDLRTIVLGLQGDFISGDLHEDSAENNAMPPTEAAMYAQDLIASGIVYLLENSTRNIVVKCSYGNHSRTTKRIHWAKEKGHSLEWMMYTNLAKYFSNEDRVIFDIADGYHSWLNIHGLDVRFHHGHAMDYRGGIGGLTIPVLRALKEWDIGKQADLDVFGHFHTHFDGGKFLANGSLIGYNPFAVRIKAPFDVPKQWFSVIDAKRGRTYAAPLYVEEGK